MRKQTGVGIPITEDMAKDVEDEVCAWKWCQAGKIILATAPRVESPTKPWFKNGVRREYDLYHPGCYRSMMLREGPSCD